MARQDSRVDESVEKSRRTTGELLDVIASMRASGNRGLRKYVDAHAALYRPPSKIGAQLNEHGEIVAIPLDAISPPNLIYEAECLALMREGLCEHLLDYAAGKISEFGKGAAYRLGDALRDLIGGHRHVLFHLKMTHGSRTLSFAARGAIEDAVRYVLWGRAGYLNDKKYNKTVREAFGVARTTVDGWVKSFSESPSQSLPSQPGEADIRRVCELMAFSAQHYRNLPGTSSAASVRARKKRVPAK